MNKFKVLNELQRCVEKVDLNLNMPTDCWDVWFRGHFIGYIDKKFAKCYAIYNADGKHIMDVDNYQKALAKFVPMAEAVNSTEWLEKMQGEPVIRQIGIREKKSLWQKIKGFFK
ncbi:hypothetical protein vBKpnAMK3_00065 [Klebsiella phage vB_Kpn_AM_K3]